MRLDANSDSHQRDSRPRGWINGTVAGIVLATFFSDFSHEMATAVLPLYLAVLGLGPAALGVIEGLADFLVSLSKLGGGVVGHHLHHKRPWVVLGYLVTTLATGAMGLVSSLAALVGLRTTAWVGRGFRGPLRDYLLAEAVEPTHYGRVYGLERSGDMLGAVAGPLVASLLVWLGIEFRSIILLTLAPGLVAAGAMFLLVKERAVVLNPPAAGTASQPRPRFPRAFWLFLIGVGLFGLGDFSRTFLIWLAARSLGEEATHTAGTVSVAVLLYTMHNLVSAAAAYPIGRLGDRRSKLVVLLCGYGLGVVTNLLLAFLGSSLPWLVVAILFSGIYIAAEETLEKAAAAEFLPRELRSLGFGILASVNAVGDMVSSLYVGGLLEVNRPRLAFGIAAVAGAAGVLWLTRIIWKGRSVRGTLV
ncbi:MAG: MFS transporter [Pirellulaceae bacterium]